MKSQSVVRSVVSIFLVLLFFLSTCSLATAQSPTPTEHQAAYARLFAIHAANMAKIKAICEKNKNQECLDLIDDMSQVIADAQEKNNRNALVGDDLATLHQTMRTKLLALHTAIVKMLTPEEVKKMNESGICPACKTAPAVRGSELKSASAAIIDPCVQYYNSYAQSASICYLYELLDEPWLYAACILLAEAVLWVCTDNYC